MANTPIIKPNIFMQMDAHHRLIVSLIIGTIVLFFVLGRYSVPTVILITWMSFALSVIIMCWIAMMNSHPREVRKIAKLQDSSRSFIFIFVVTASIVSM